MAMGHLIGLRDAKKRVQGWRRDWRERYGRESGAQFLHFRYRRSMTGSGRFLRCPPLPQGNRGATI
jgi:hypothetical protein